MQTMLVRTSATDALFRVRPDSSDDAAALAALGFAQRDDVFERRVAAGDDLERIFARFTRHLGEIVLQKLGRRPAPWRQGLRTAAERLTGDMEWWLCGSGALAARGLDVAPRDLDFVVSDACRAGELLSDLLVEPVSPLSGWIARWFGRAFDGCLIEWLADVDASVAPAPNEYGRAAELQLEHVRWEGFVIPCSPLDLALAACEQRGLTQRVAAIRDYRAGVTPSRW